MAGAEVCEMPAIIPFVGILFQGQNLPGGVSGEMKSQSWDRTSVWECCWKPASLLGQICGMSSFRVPSSGTGSAPLCVLQDAVKLWQL